MENKIKFKEPDYKKIRELSHRIDCTVTQADFDTQYPNPLRIHCMMGDIYRHFKHVRGKK